MTTSTRTAVEPRADRRPALASVAVAGLVALTGLGAAASMVVRGRQPNAELGGVLAFVGVALLVPALLLLAVSLTALRDLGRRRRRGFTLTVVLGGAEVAIGLVAAVAFGVVLSHAPAAASVPAGAVGPSPVAVVGLVLGLACAAAGCVGVVGRRGRHLTDGRSARP